MLCGMEAAFAAAGLHAVDILIWRDCQRKVAGYGSDTFTLVDVIQHMP